MKFKPYLLNVNNFSSTSQIVVKIRAATRMQNLYRSRKAWKRLTKTARDVYVKFYDSSSDRFYFYNPRTKVSTWKKPKILGHFDTKLSETSARPKVYAKDLDENDAASMLQSLYRKRLARRHVLQLVENLYVRVKDEKTGKYYYFNKSSGTSSCRREFFSESFLSDFFFFLKHRAKYLECTVRCEDSRFISK